MIHKNTEIAELLYLARTTLAHDFAGAMLPIIEETAKLVFWGTAVQQASCAIEYAEFATRSSGLVMCVFALCSDLLWEAEPCV